VFGFCHRERKRERDMCCLEKCPPSYFAEKLILVPLKYIYFNHYALFYL
jgi:hypothetical protein